MIPDDEIAAMKDPSQGNTWADDVRAMKRLLAERELLVEAVDACRVALVEAARSPANFSEAVVDQATERMIGALRAVEAFA